MTVTGDFRLTFQTHWWGIRPQIILGKFRIHGAALDGSTVVEMIKAASDTGATLLPQFNSDAKVPTDWEQKCLVCLYKGKGDALDRGNYRPNRQ